MIVVTTPTGRIGSQLVEQLLGRRADVRVVVRDASALSDEVRGRVDVVEGSHADARTLDRALPGADALFWLVPPNPAAPSALDHYLAFARAGASAVRRHRVGHVVGITSAGHGWSRPAGVLSAAFAMDSELERTGAAYRALSLPFYMENLLGQVGLMTAQGAFSLTCAADQPLAMIATRDIAARAADLLADLSWTGREDAPLFGPDRLAPDDLARIITEELGRPVVYKRISMDELAGMARSRGASEQGVADTLQMFAAQDEGIYDADWAHAAVAETDFRTWCRAVLEPAARRAAGSA